MARDWKAYNNKLINRGGFAMYISKDLFKTWYADHEGKPHRPRIYSDELIYSALSIRYLFNLTYRQVSGFLDSVLSLYGVRERFSVPSYTQLNRRQKNLPLDFFKKLQKNNVGKSIIALDSTGLSICSPGQWHAKKYNKKTLNKSG